MNTFVGFRLDCPLGIRDFHPDVEMIQRAKSITGKILSSKRELDYFRFSYHGDYPILCKDVRRPWKRPQSLLI